MRSLKRLATRVCNTVLMAAAVGAPVVAWAQTEGVPQPTLNRGSPVWLGYLVMILLLAVVVAVSLMPSKRGHQD